MKTIRNIIAVGLMGLMGLMGSRAYAQCDMPTALTATHVTGTAATITWDYDTTFTSTGFSVIVSSDNYSVTYPVSSSERRLVLTDLEERTSYRVQLTPACTGADTVSITFATPCVSGGELVIGDGTATNSSIPVRLLRKYSLSQQIFTAAELNGTTAISGVRFYKTSGVARERQLEVYMDTTSVATYSTTADYVPQDTTHRFFAGTVSFPATGWVEIVFDSTFTMPAGMNVILTVNDLTGTTGSLSNFQATETAGYMTVYGGRTTNQAFNPADSQPFAGLTLTNSNVISTRSNVVFLTPCDSVACYPPYITDADPGETSVDLHWVASTVDNYRVEYRQADSSAWTVAAAAVGGGFYTITSLDYATDYVIRVTTLCAVESSADSINVTMLCPVYALPFTESFDNFICSGNSDDMQHCWYRTYINNTRYPQLDNSGSGVLQFFNRGALVLPEMDANIDTLAVSFIVKSSATRLQQMEIGVAVDPMDTATYTVLRTVTVDNYVDEWKWVTVYLDNYSGEGNHIFVRTKSMGKIYMDSIAVDYIPACRQIAGATVVERTDSSLTLVVADEWLHDSYTLYWGTVAGEQNATDSLTVTGTTVTINGLASNTTYYIYVRGNCGGQHGPFRTVRPTGTLCMAVVVTENDPYIEDFEGGGLTCMWQQSDSNHSEWQYVTNTWLAPNGGDTTMGSNLPNDIYMHSGGGAANLGLGSRPGTAMLVLPTFDFNSMDSNAVLLFYYFQEQDYDEYYNQMADLIQQGFSDVEVDAFPHALEIYYRTEGSGAWNLLTLVDTTHSKIWKRHVYTLPASAGAASYQVAILGHKGEAGIYGVFIDDIRVGVAATICDEPTAVSVSDVSDRFATVHWIGNAPSYSVQWRPAKSYAWQGREVTGGDTAVIGPLEVATRYVVRVVAQCSLMEQSEPSDTVVFTTNFCPQSIVRNNFTDGDTVIVSAQAPVDLRVPCTYVEMLIDSATLAGMTEIKGFDFYVTDAGLPQLPPGMVVPGMLMVCRGEYIQRCEMYMGHTTDTVLTDFHYDSTFSMLSWRAEIYFSDTGRWRVYFDTAFAWDGHSNVVFGIYQYNPMIHLTGGPVSFAAHTESGNKVYGGFGAGSSTFTMNQGPISQTLGLASITSERRWTSNVVPNLTFLSCEPVCHEPTVTNVSSTTSSVSVGWYDRFANIELQIKEASDTIWTGDTIVNTMGHTFTGLSDMTTYDIRLRRVCSVVDDDNSEWVMLHAATGVVVSCSTPTSLTITAVTRTSATFSWTDGPAAGNRWQLHVWNSEWERYYDASTNPVTIDGLMPNSSYHAAVRANCGEGIVGAWSDAVLFDNTCHMITDLVADEVGNSAEVNWAAGSNNTQWIISYGHQGFNVNQTLGYYTVDTTRAIIDNLHNGSIYGFRVMPVCGEGWHGAWSEEETLHITGEGIGDVDGGNVRLFPNPASHTVTVSGMDGSCTITLVDMNGRTISEFYTHGADFTLNLEGYARGAYFVRITNERTTAVRKLVVK